MSKPKSAAAKRPSPPDRDGDGAPGGSLPGNQTADAAKGPDLLDKIIEAKDQLEAGPDFVDHGRDNDRIHARLLDAGVRGKNGGALALETVARWSDEDVRAAADFAEQMTAPGAHTDNVGDERTADFKAIELPAILGDHEILRRREATPADEPAPADEDGTFTPEEIAAGQTDLIQEEGETAIAAALAAPVIDDADPLVTIDTATATVVLRLGNLRRLVENRLFYKSAEGFSPNYHAPHVEASEVEVWIANGLARWDETAGRIGGVYVEDEARRVLRGQARAA